MDEKLEPDVLVQRLHSLAVQRGLTIKEMAEKSGVPKSSLEGYMRLKGAKRPGIDAVTAIANAMGVSIDWLVGRSDGRQIGEEDRRQIALGVFRLLLEVLRDLETAQEQSPKPILHDGKVGNRSIQDFALQTMLHFLARENLFPAPDYEGFRIVDELLQGALE